MEIVYEVIAGITLTRGEAKVSLARGARLKLDVHDHDFDLRQLDRAVREGRLRQLPLGWRE